MQAVTFKFDPAKLFDMVQALVELANATQATLTGDFAEIRAILDASDVVYAVWQDAREPLGVGTLLVKGQQHLREVIADGEPIVARVAAIPCVDPEQAEALRQVAGEPDRRH